MSASIAVRIWIWVVKFKYYNSLTLASTNTHILPIVRFQGLSFFPSLPSHLPAWFKLPSQLPPLSSCCQQGLPCSMSWFQTNNSLTSASQVLGFQVCQVCICRVYFWLQIWWYICIKIHTHTYIYIIIYRWIFKRKTCHFNVLPHWSNSLGIIVIEFMTEIHCIRN